MLINFKTMKGEVVCRGLKKDPASLGWLPKLVDDEWVVQTLILGGVGGLPGDE